MKLLLFRENFLWSFVKKYSLVMNARDLYKPFCFVQLKSYYKFINMSAHLKSICNISRYCLLK